MRMIIGLIISAQLLVGIASANVLSDADFQIWKTYGEKVDSKQVGFYNAMNGSAYQEYDSNCLQQLSYIFERVSYQADAAYYLISVSTLMKNRDDETVVNKTLRILLGGHQKNMDSSKAYVSRIRGRCGQSAVTNSYAQELLALIDEAGLMRTNLLNKIGR